MVRFLNQFSNEAQHYASEKTEYLKSLFESFLTSASELPERVFQAENGARFSIALFEAAFVAACARAYKDRSLVDGRLSAESVSELREDEDFIQASRVATTQSANVPKTIERSRRIGQSRLMVQTGTERTRVDQMYEEYIAEETSINSGGCSASRSDPRWLREFGGDAELDGGIRSFLELGNERNQLVHEDYGSFPLEKTSGQIYESYRSALGFIDALPALLRDSA